MVIIVLENHSDGNEATELLFKPRENARILHMLRPYSNVPGLVFLHDGHAEVTSRRWADWAKENKIAS